MADAEPKMPEVKNLRPPVQCVLWQQPDLVVAGKDRFEVVETFADESHLSRTLLKCRECGQLYFSEFYENIDWEDGDDAQYSAYIPVTTPEEIEALKRGSIYDILLYFPRLQWDKPTGKGTTLRWIGKET